MNTVLSLSDNLYQYDVTSIFVCFIVMILHRPVTNDLRFIIIDSGTNNSLKRLPNFSLRFFEFIYITFYDQRTRSNN